MARLNENQRRELWLADKRRTMSVQKLCEQYGCSRTTLANIRKEYEDVSTTQSEHAEAPTSPTESGSERSENIDNNSEPEGDSGSVADNNFERNFPSYLAIDEEDTSQPEAVRPVPVETFYVPPAEIIREPTPPPHIPTEYQVTKEKLYLCDKIRAFVHSFHHKLGAICGNSEIERERGGSTAFKI